MTAGRKKKIELPSPDDNTASGVMDISAITRILDPNMKMAPCLVLVGGSPRFTGYHWKMDQERHVLGRSLGSDIHIEEGSLSKTHAAFTVDGDKVSVTDLGSTNKTLVNGTPLAPNKPRVLENNDKILTGALIFKFLQKGIISETLEKSRMQGELEQARSLQKSLFPPNAETKYGPIRIGGRYRTVSECGGDWWWHWRVGEKVFAIIADATGHGAGAALLTSAARATVTMMDEDESIGVEKVFRTLTRALRKCAGGDIHMSAFIVEANFKSPVIRYVNASHVPALRLPPLGVECNMENTRFLFDGLSASLGSADAECKVAECDMPPGSRLVLLTDGLTDRQTAAGLAIGELAFYRMLLRTHAAHRGDQKKFLDDLLKGSDNLVKNAPQDDDITVVALDFTSPARASRR